MDFGAEEDAVGVVAEPEGAGAEFVVGLEDVAFFGVHALDFDVEQARMVVDVFIGEMVGWSWGEDRYGRVGAKFRLKTNSAELITTERRGRREVEQPKVGPEGARRAGASELKGTERLLAKHRVHGMESPWKSDGSASHPYPGVSLGAAAPGAERNQEALEALEALRRALRVQHYALRTEESYLH